MNFLLLCNIFISHALITHNFLNANARENRRIYAFVIQLALTDRRAFIQFCRPLTFVFGVVQQFVIYANHRGPSADSARGEEKEFLEGTKGSRKLTYCLGRSFCLAKYNHVFHFLIRYSSSFVTWKSSFSMLSWNRERVHPHKRKMSTKRKGHCFESANLNIIGEKIR